MNEPEATGTREQRALRADVVVVGAGMSGLTAAIELERSGIEVVVVDKGRAVGGRMASRRIGGARFDHGAQHFSARDARFRSQVDTWTAAGLVDTWFSSPSLTHPERGEEPRRVAVGGMRTLPEHLAEALDVRTGVTVNAITRSPGGVTVEVHDGPALEAAGLILTAPIPQMITLLDAGDIEIPPALRSELSAIRYDACLAVMAELDRPSGLPDGHLAPPGDPIAWLGDNQDKGTSTVPAVTIHSTPDFAIVRQDDDPAVWTDELARAAEHHLDAKVIAASNHRWLYAQPQTTLEVGAMDLQPGAPVVLAGEVFAGARVEGAYLSGLAAAEQMQAGLR
jgi:renalase